MPYPLAFMVLPIVLHKSTRSRLPRSTRTSMASWLQENGDAKVQFGNRVVALKAHTREAILFGCAQQRLEFGTGIGLHTRYADSEIERFIRTLEGEAKECMSKARQFGKWIASAGTAQTIMVLWGIRP